MRGKGISYYLGSSNHSIERKKKERRAYTTVDNIITINVFCPFED